MKRVFEAACILPMLAGYTGLAWLQPVLAGEIVRFCAFALAFVILPAYAIALLLLPRDFGPLERISLGYPVVQGLMFVLVSQGWRFGLAWLPYLLLALAVLALASIFVGRASQPTERFTLAAVALLSIFGTALVLHYALHSPLPTLAQAANFYVDDSRMTVMIHSAMRTMSGVPLEDIYMAGQGLVYHSIQLFSQGYAAQLTGTPPLHIMLYLWPMLHWSLLAGAVVCGARRLGGLSPLHTCIAIFLLLFMSSRDLFSMTTLQLYGNYHAYFNGFPSFIILFFLLYGYLGERTDKLHWLYGALVFFTAAGSKAILLFMIPVALLPVLFIRLAQRRVTRDDLLFTGLVLLAVLALKLTMYTDPGVATMKDVSFAGRVFNGVEALIALTVILLPYAGFLGVLAHRNPVARHRLRRDVPFAIFTATFALFSVVILQVVNFVGGTQYFYWYSKIFTMLLFSGAVLYTLERRKKWYAGAALLIMLFGHYSMLQQHFLVTAPNIVDDMAKQSLDHDEYTAMLWAAANLDHTKIVFSNRTFYMENRPFRKVPMVFIDYLSVSGMRGYAWLCYYVVPDWRVVYARRTQAQETFFAVPPEDQDALLRLLPVDYLFFCKRFETRDFSAVKGLRLVYENPSVAIYEVVRSGPRPPLDDPQHPLPLLVKENTHAAG